MNDDTTPATRLYCTTQCDWSSSSMLKGTITPAVIKGQKEYHEKLVSAIKDWIKVHPDDFQTAAGSKGGEVQEEKTGETEGNVPEKSPDGARTQVAQQQKGAMELLGEIPENPIMLWITIVCGMSLALNIFLLGRL